MSGLLRTKTMLVSNLFTPLFVLPSINRVFYGLFVKFQPQPFQKLQDELKSYLRRHQHKLTELGEPVKELVESYNIAEIIEQSQVSESISQMPEEETRSSDDEGHFSTSSTMATGKLTPKCLNTVSTQATSQVTSPVKTIESPKKETSQKKNLGSKLRENLRMNSAISKSASGSLNRSRSVKKSDKPRLETNKSGAKKYARKADAKEGALVFLL